MHKLKCCVRTGTSTVLVQFVKSLPMGKEFKLLFIISIFISNYLLSSSSD